MVVILGTGIAGLSTAYYYLQQQPGGSVTLVDAAAMAAQTSSTKAGAFVPFNWDRASPKQSLLFAPSYELHRELASALDLETFNEIPCAHRLAELETNHLETLSDPSAMVNPAELTQKLLDWCLQHGAKLVTGHVTGMEHVLDDNLCTATKILLRNGPDLSLPIGEQVVVALGPWSSQAEDWLELPLPVEGVVSTSLIWNADAITKLPSGALFCPEDARGCHLEVFPRLAVSTTPSSLIQPQRQLYVSGCGASEVWSPAIFRNPTTSPDPTQACPPNTARAQAAHTSLREQLAEWWIPPELLESEPTTTQACIRPTTPDGMPIVGQLRRTTNVHVCTGGGPWGVTWGPLMGQTLATLLLTDEDDASPDVSIRLGPLQPQRFDTLLYRSLLTQRRAVSDEGGEKSPVTDSPQVTDTGR